MAHEGVPLVVIQRQLGHANLGITSSTYRASIAARSSAPSTGSAVAGYLRHGRTASQAVDRPVSGSAGVCRPTRRPHLRLAICETRPAPRAETCLHVPAGTTAGQPCDPCCTEAATYRRQSRIASRLLRARSGKDGRHGPERRVGDVCGDHLRRGIPGSSRPNTRARRLRLLLEEDPRDPPPPRGGPPGRRGVP